MGSSYVPVVNVVTTFQYTRRTPLSIRRQLSYHDRCKYLHDDLGKIVIHKS